MRRFDRSHYGWMELIIGILLIIMGIFSMFKPKSALTAIVMIYGLIAFLTGLDDIIFYVKMNEHTGFGPTISLVTGILSIMVGLVLLVHPGAGRWAFAVFFPLWFIAHCVSKLSHLNVVRYTAGERYYRFTMAVNIIGLVLGILMLIQPAMMYLSFGIVVGIYLILMGVDNVVEALGKMGSEW